MKKNQLSTVEKSIEERIVQLKSKLLWVKGKHEKCSRDLSVKTEQLESVKKELEVIEKEVQKVKTYAANCNEELELKLKGLAMVKSLISDSNCELELKQKQLETLQGLANVQSSELKKKQTKVEFLDKSISELSSKVGWKKKNLVSVERHIKRLTEKLRSKEEDFNSLKATTRTYCKDLELKVREFNAIRESIRERNEELALKEKLLKEKQFEACLKKFELKEQKTHAICQNRQTLEPFDFHLQAHQPDNSCTANSQSSTSIDEKTSPSILTDDMCNNDSLPNEVLAALKSSADPAMFVLCVMQDSYSHSSRNCGAGRDTSVKTKILLMERLIEVSPTISPAVKAQAAKLVVSWKANLSSGTEKLTEIFAFLLFLAAYKLVHHIIYNNFE
ncbi:uncharacterized protein [Euphorbia lathyris]|uniref:uncharacterized protein n=1 Tax=Euphorbia lathyris TaxID=212925 RepID=UPI003313DEB2